MMDNHGGYAAPEDFGPVLSDREITFLAKKFGMIDPFVEENVRSVEGQPVVSYGVGSFGYDLRVSNEFRVFANTYGGVIDPKQFDPKGMVTETVADGEAVIIPPNSFALAVSKECFHIPTNVITICLGKSTYARCGIQVHITPFEPGWRGYPTLEVSNTTPMPAKIYAGEGLCQVLFFKAQSPEVTYAARSGKYQDQPERVITPKM